MLAWADNVFHVSVLLKGLNGVLELNGVVANAAFGRHDPLVVLVVPGGAITRSHPSPSLATRNQRGADAQGSMFAARQRSATSRESLPNRSLSASCAVGHARAAMLRSDIQIQLARSLLF
jgi:hypothetical protein